MCIAHSKRVLSNAIYIISIVVEEGKVLTMQVLNTSPHNQVMVRMCELFCAKSAQENNKYSRNDTNLKISHLSKPHSPCKGYSLCKMVNFGRKLKMPKTCEKRFYKNNRVILCKKAARKSTKYSRIATKNYQSKERAQPMQRPWPVQNGQFGSKV